MATTSISQLTTAATVDNGDLFEIAHPDAGSATGYASNKQTLASIADHIATAVNFPGLNTTSKNIVGALNELEAGGGGGGTTVVANPVGEPTDTLDTVQIGNTIYDIEGNAIEYMEYTIDSLTNGTIDTSRGGCWYARYGNIVHLHLAVKDLTAETNTNVFTMPVGLRPPHVTCIGIGIGEDRNPASSLTVGAVSGVCNLWSEATRALVDVEWTIDDSGSGSGGSGGANYSTTEHVVGTWTDGSTLYEKTYIWTWADIQSGSASGGRAQGEFDTTFGDEINMIWIDFGNSYIKFTGTNAENASIVSQPLAYATANGGYTRINIQRRPSMNNNKMFCWFDATYPTDIAADTSKWKWIVTFRYTKATS